ncbi:MAG: TetR/AcrR family transcriptional regulator [Acidimicrobiia bacterium]
MKGANVTPGAEPRQDRSRQRREALLRAAIQLLGETGVKSVTHRAVAERAGVPLASTTYYFRSVNELIEEALKLHVAERVSELSGLADVALSVTGASATQFAERFAEVLVANPTPTLVAHYQMYLEAGRNPTLRPAVADALAAFEALTARLLAAAGARDPQAAAEAFLALLDGFAIHRLARPRDPEREAAALFTAMRALFLEQVMDTAARDELHEQLRRPLGSPSGIEG